MKNKNLIIAMLGIILALLAAVEGWRLFTAGKQPAETAGNGAERKVLYWTDPMVPGYRSDKPGKSPFMDMDLVPVYEEQNDPVRRARRHGASGNRGEPRRAHLPGRTRRAHARTRRPGLSVPGRPGHARTAGYFRARRLGASGHVGHGARSRRARTPLGRRGRKREFRRGHRRAFAQGARARGRGCGASPNEFADVVIQGAPRLRQRIMVPREAMIRTGRRNAVVLGLGGGRFQPVEVEVGEESGDWIEIRRGVKEGDTVVVSGRVPDRFRSQRARQLPAHGVRAGCSRSARGPLIFLQPQMNADKRR